MIGGLLVLAGAVVSVLAFPRFGPGWLILPGVTLFLAGLRTAPNRGRGLVYGALYGLTFFGGLIWWLSELGWLAVVPLVIVQAAYLTAYGWWLARYNDRSSGTWFLLAVGGWALMELIRYRFPVSGFQWGAAGYALSDESWARALAPLYGTSGITVMVPMLAAGVVALTRTPRNWWVLAPIPALVALAGGVLSFDEDQVLSVGHQVAIVQGSTPCPYQHCPPDERLRTFQQHLELTKEIEPGSASLVVWSEGSTGSSNADPVQNPEIGAAIAAEARRIGAWFVVGGDRPVSEIHWINANVVFNPDGEIVGEYRKQHPVPFGEYIPWRPVFEWIPDLDQVPRDMIPGEGPVVFDMGDLDVGTVISFEGSFSRYPRQHARAGANVMVLASNEGSYGTTPGSDQFIGMTRMRAAELGLDLVHAAVTGKSTVIDSTGRLGGVTGLGTQEILYGTVTARSPSPYAATGDILMLATALIGLAAWWRARVTLVGSAAGQDEEE